MDVLSFSLEAAAEDQLEPTPPRGSVVLLEVSQPRSLDRVDFVGLPGLVRVKLLLQKCRNKGTQFGGMERKGQKSQGVPAAPRTPLIMDSLRKCPEIIQEFCGYPHDFSECPKDFV